MEPWQICIICGVIALVLLTFLFIILKTGKAVFKNVFLRRKNDATFAQDENPEAKKWPSRIWFFNQKIEELSLESFDHLKLKGYFLNNHSHKLAIICHGYHGRYYSSTVQAKIFYENGYDVLLINNRAHDTSDGKSFTMGPKEQKDVLRWIDLMVQKNPNYQIALMGVSMGAHVAMMTAARKELPSNVKCLIEDCGYQSLRDEIRYEIKRTTKIKPYKFVTFCGEVYCLMFHHFSFNDSTKKAFKNLKIPALFIHGDKDDYVPYDNLKKNADAVPGNIYHEEVTFEGAGHNQSNWQLDKFTSTVINFVNRFIK